MMTQLNTLLCLLAGISFDVLLQERAGSAIQVWVCLLMQIHFDCGTAGLTEVGNLLSAVSRALRLSAWNSGGEVLGVTDIMKPLWKAFATWKKVEPYEYRFPLPRAAVHAVLGVCVIHNEWLLLLFVLLCHHCWLRPAEALGLHWEDLVLDPLLEVAGVVKIKNPKTKSPHSQHVIIEDPDIAVVCRTIKSAFCRSEQTHIFPFTTFALHRKWSHVCSKLQITDVLHDPRLSVTKPTLGGLRSSGATLDFLVHENLDRVKWRGRWASDPVLKHYLQLGVYHLAALKFSESTRRLFVNYGSVYQAFLGRLLASDMDSVWVLGTFSAPGATQGP